MFRSATFSLAAVASIVFLGAVSYGLFFDGAALDARYGTNLRASTSGFSPSKAASAISTHTVAPRGLAIGNDDPTRPLSGADSPDDQVPTQSHLSTSLLTKRADIIGQRFPISASVEAPCSQQAKRGNEAQCGEVLPLLSEMSQEPRDETWAPAMEEKLRNLIMNEPAPFEIRDIECRTSLCAVEVASANGAFYIIPRISSDVELSENLLVWTAAFGYELNPSGAKITVTLPVLKRR